jgi:hypothetical protein
LINRFGCCPGAIGLMFAVSPIRDARGTPCRCKLFFRRPDGLRIAADDPGTPVEIKRKLKKTSALCENAGMAAGARDRASALPYWLILLYRYNPGYFKSVSEDTLWVQNLPLASIEYCQQFAFEKSGRPKGRAPGGETFDTKTLRGDLVQSVFAVWCGVSRATIQRLEGGSHLSPKTSEKIRKTAQSTLDDPKATRAQKALAREILKRLGGTTTRPRR